MRTTLIFIYSLFFSITAHSQELSTVPVTVKPLSEVLIERKLTANAQVMAPNNSQISSEITAVVNTIHADTGDQIAKGDLLISLDGADLKLQLESAKANSQAAQARLNQADLRLDRAKELKTYISSDDLLGRETEVAVFKADMLSLKVAEKIAQRQLSKTQIKAPFDGVVTSRQAQLGQLLTLGSPILNLVQITGTEIQAKIPSHLSDQLTLADRIEFTTQNQTTEVELIKLSAVVDQQAGIQTARFKPLNNTPTVGQTGQLVWYLEGQLLAADLVVKRQGQLGVFIAQNNKAQFIVLPEAQEGRPVPIDAATIDSQNWQVIIGGRERLQDGQAISQKSSGQ